MFILSSVKRVELGVVVISANCLTYPKLFYFTENQSKADLAFPSS